MRTTQNEKKRGLAGPFMAVLSMAAFGLGALTLARPVDAAKGQTPTATAEAREELKETAAAFRRVVADRPIPPALLDRALAVVVFDDLVKAAFIVGGTGGDGVMLRKTATGWSAPAFVNLAGASVGAQIGGSRTDAVMLFMDRVALDALVNGRFEFGTAITATAGPTTATAEAATKSTSHVLVYAKQEGLFAGVSANGIKISLDEEENRAVYGTAMSDLVTGTVATPEGLGGLAAAIKGFIKPGASN